MINNFKTVFMKFVKKGFLPLLLAVTLLVGMAGCKSKPKDADISAAIAEKTKTVPDLASLTANVKEGVVTLTGECKDATCRANCEAAVKSVAGVKEVVNNTTVAPPPPAPAPVEVAADDPLTKGVADATKDFAGVTATVNDGVITLTGDLKRTDLPRLMKSLNTLKPKKIENKLTLK
jgi:hyperosmotically inducible periplasmic protein